MQQIRLTTRDLDYLTLLYTHSFLDCLAVSQLTGTRLKTVQHRFTQLRQAGYVGCPPVQDKLVDLHKNHLVGGSLPYVYALYDKGAQVLYEQRGIGVEAKQGRWKDRFESREDLVDFKHDLTAARTVAGLAQACRGKNIPWLDHSALQGRDDGVDYQDLLTLKVLAKDPNQPSKQTIKPDYAFGMQLKPERDLMVLLLEQDRGSEQLKFLPSKKTIAGMFQRYNWAHEQRVFQRKYGYNFRVLLVTETKTHA